MVITSIGMLAVVREEDSIDVKSRIV